MSLCVTSLQPNKCSNPLCSQKKSGQKTNYKNACIYG
jgi:hypothetical protein